MEDGLGEKQTKMVKTIVISLNPYFNGRRFGRAKNVIIRFTAKYVEIYAIFSIFNKKKVLFLMECKGRVII